MDNRERIECNDIAVIYFKDIYVLHMTITWNAKRANLNS